MSAAETADKTAVRNAWALYTQQKYAASADAFESLIKTSTPNARLYYYAAMANKSCNRTERAKQLNQYVATNFPGSPEAAYAQKALKETPAATDGGMDNLPASLKGKTIDELMQTEEGRKALKEALNQQKTKSATASSGASSTASGSDKKKPVKESGRAIPAETIAQDGPAGVTQFTGHPNGWFEASLAALSMLPRGQELISAMIHTSSAQNTYIVRFPTDGVDYLITPQKMEAIRVHDKALWATLIHCAALMKLNRGSGSIDEGLTLLTGKKAEKLYPANTTEQALIRFIGDAVKAQIPIVGETADDFGTFPELVEDNHVYTITGFDSATNMITIRDPHGDNSRRFRLKTDPEHQKFEQLNEGVLKMHVSIFPHYFAQLASYTY